MISSNRLSPLFTIGHSALKISEFRSLLQSANVRALCDVRSSPYSKYAPQFNSPSLIESLRNAGITYLFLGKNLGGRIDEPDCYINGRIDYSRVQATSKFKTGVGELLSMLQRMPTAIMCTEKDPINCHRYLLIAKHLRAEVEINHILHNGVIEKNSDTEKRLFQATRTAESDFFENSETLIERAYKIQGDKVSFVAEDTVQ